MPRHKVLALMGHVRFETPDPVLGIPHPDLYRVLRPSSLYYRALCES
jgi:hypothetical protein